MNDPEALRARLYASYATTHLGQPDALGNRPAFRAHILPHVPADRDAAILDVGCGSGMLLRFLRDEGYKNLAGVDTSEEQVALARGAGLEGVEHGDLRDHLASRGGLDVVLAVDVLEHFSRDEVLEVLDAVHSALKPGGRLVLRTPNATSPFGGRVRYWDFTHELAFTTGSITQVLATTGYDRVSIHPATPPAHGAKSFARWVTWSALAAVFRLYLVAETGVVRGHVLTQNLIAVAHRPDR